MKVWKPTSEGENHPCRPRLKQPKRCSNAQTRTQEKDSTCWQNGGGHIRNVSRHLKLIMSDAHALKQHKNMDLDVMCDLKDRSSNVIIDNENEAHMSDLRIQNNGNSNLGSFDSESFSRIPRDQRADHHETLGEHIFRCVQLSFEDYVLQNSLGKKVGRVHKQQQ